MQDFLLFGWAELVVLLAGRLADALAVDTLQCNEYDTPAGFGVIPLQAGGLAAEVFGGGAHGIVAAAVAGLSLAPWLYAADERPVMAGAGALAFVVPRGDSTVIVDTI